MYLYMHVFKYLNVFKLRELGTYNEADPGRFNLLVNVFPPLLDKYREI